MELLAALVLLYGLQCTQWLARGGALFVESALGAWHSEGPGFRLLHPWPSARGWLAARLPLVEVDGALCGRGAATWLSARGSDLAVPVALAALAGASAATSRVDVAGRPFARGADEADAERIAAWLRALAASGEAGAGPLVDTELARAASLAGFRAARERFERGARWLGWTSDAYFVCLFLLLPLGIALTASDYALRLLLPAVGVLHLATWAALAHAHARLFPARRGDRWKLLIETILYPPSLLRAHAALRNAAVASFHPAAVAAGVLADEEAQDYLRGEWVRAAAREREAEPGPPALALARRELDALRGLLRERGETPEALLAAPVRSDPLARSYCPACRSEYRVEAGDCSDCALPLQAFAAPHAPGTGAAESR